MFDVTTDIFHALNRIMSYWMAQLSKNDDKFDRRKLSKDGVPFKIDQCHWVNDTVTDALTY